MKRGKKSKAKSRLRQMTSKILMNNTIDDLMYYYNVVFSVLQGMGEYYET